MTHKRFKHLLNGLGMQFICYDDKEVLIGTFADRDGVAHIVELLNELAEENKEIRSDLIDHSALISMLEDYQALKIEDTLWNLTGAESEEEFNELYKPYLEKAKQNWSRE